MTFLEKVDTSRAALDRFQKKKKKDWLIPYWFRSWIWCIEIAEHSSIETKNLLLSNGCTFIFLYQWFFLRIFLWWFCKSENEKDTKLTGFVVLLCCFLQAAYSMFYEHWIPRRYLVLAVKGSNRFLELLRTFSLAIILGRLKANTSRHRTTLHSQLGINFSDKKKICRNS